MTSSPKVSPDDLCGVCETTRENHGDRNHEFDMGGELKPIKPGPPPRQEPPKLKGSTKIEGPAVDDLKAAQLNLRMMDLLVAKGIFDAVDLMYILGDGYVSARGQTPKTTD